MCRYKVQVLIVCLVFSLSLARMSLARNLDKRDARGFFRELKRDFDINFTFQLRKMGIINTNRRGSNSTQKCYGPLGCLEINEDWYGLTRPVNVLPQDRSDINTRFFIRTRENEEGQPFNVSDPSAFLQTTFNASRPTKIIVHGFIDDGFVPWVQEMSSALLSVGDFNVIAVDWGGGSSVMYSQAAANTRLVGLEVANLINLLKIKYSADPQTFHIIGHSLGSHVAGYAGKRLKELDEHGKGGGKLGRISALDPAEPLFQSMPKFVRLDADDAVFVDVIHTDAKSILMLGYGMVEPVGHVDFYPNGGDTQPGCSLMDLPVSFNSIADPDKTADSVKRHLVACSHTRALELYIESISSKNCKFVGHKCDSYEKFKKGHCFGCGSEGENCAIMGYNSIEYFPITKESKNTNVKFYLDTGKASPFCQFQYLLEVNIGHPPEAERWVQGYLKANIHGAKGEESDINLTPEPVSVAAGSKLSFLFESESDLILSDKVLILWEDVSKTTWSYCLWSCRSQLHVKNIGIHFKRIYPFSVVDDEIVLCGDSKGEDTSLIKSGEWKLFYKPCG